MKTNTKNALKKSIFIAFLLILITVVFSIVVKYDVEGEATLPYSLEKILIVSKVSTSNNEDSANLWNISLEEDNDVYLYINKTDEESDNTIKSISLENFTVTNQAKIGEPVIYRPTGDLNNLYDLSEQNYLGSSITYNGAKADTLKTLEVRNEGGTIGFRASLENLGNYISNNYDEEIVYDGSLLTKAGISLENIQFSISFDILITLNNDITFKGTINLDFPNDDIITNPESNYEITDFSDVVFKRV